MTGRDRKSGPDFRQLGLGERGRATVLSVFIHRGDNKAGGGAALWLGGADIWAEPSGGEEPFVSAFPGLVERAQGWGGVGWGAVDAQALV